MQGVACRQDIRERSAWARAPRASKELLDALHPRMSATAAAEGPTTAVTAPERLPIAAEVLDGGELVLLAIKPSLLFILFDAARWVLFGGILLIISAIPSLRLAGLTSSSVAELACLLVALRLGIALLRWVSRFYILTNRRIMRLHGVFRADILSCPLLSIRSMSVRAAWHERLTRLGTILFVADGAPDGDLHWYNIARSEEIHARIRRAIERAIQNQPRS